MSTTLAAEPQAPEAAPEPRPWWRRRRVQVTGGAAALLALLFLWLTWALPLSRALEPLGAPTLVLITADGKPFARRGSYKEAPVDAARLPAHVTSAFIAIEDRRFNHHMGLDLRAIGRALVTNARSGEVRQGGSTITQQLAKNAFLSNERSLRRKAQEAVIAVYLELRLSKAEILSRYLSSVYFGDGVFGLRAAARHYFDKAPEQLTLGEAAMLAGVVKAPTRLAPTADFEAARERAQVVLASMVDAGMITDAEARRALRRVKVREGRASLPVGSYFADWISPQVKQAFNRAYGEVEVWTTLDSALQRQAQNSIRRVMAGAGAYNASQAALVAMRTDGRVVAMVGGLDYRKSQFNRAAQAERQPGSAFKPFVYMAALRRGLSTDSLVLDQPVTIGGWAPENHEGRYAGGPVPLRDAFARSSNVAAARLIQQVGPGAVIEAARDLGVTAPLPNDATLALGTGEMTLLDLTAAYAGIAAGQAPVRPRGLLTEEPAPGRPLARRERDGLLLMLQDVVRRGTGTAANAGPGVYGKTGTSQDYRDAWFVGFAGDLVVGVWVGNDDNQPMRRVTGGMLPAQIFRDFMAFAMRREDFKAPAEVQDVPLLDLETFSDEGLTTLPDLGLGEPPPLEAPPIPGEEPAILTPAPQVRPEELDVPPAEPDEEPPVLEDAPPPPGT
ncbi:PBP1A family penicillin-binding protein [Phenylobacterium sp.]|uniref:transglycosylase domain-containing protein n=1 Tax=Phenylobacterium sp. TaxID=1871053 RepID=UPI002811A739|nr:PBP1A family penicillin-binding protein [Phenylobacterium sp.]